MMGQSGDASRMRAIAERLCVSQLLILNSSILSELRDREVVRSANNPVGDYAEYLFSQAFGWKLVGNSAAGHDAVARRIRYQIKARRLHPRNMSRQLSFFRRLPDANFEYLAGLLLNEDYTVLRAALVPHKLLEPHSRFSSHANGWLFKLEDDVWDWHGVKDVTRQLKAAANKVGLLMKRGFPTSP
jgi:hypothetical protein